MTSFAFQQSITLNDGHKLPQLGLGVWQLKNNTDTTKVVRTALDEGYRLIDTAAAYGNEEAIGTALKQTPIDRKELHITTKLWNADQGKDRVEKAFFKSLKNLQLDYIDVYLIHWPMPRRNTFIETWKVLENLQKRGYIKSIGVSNFSEANLALLLKHTEIIPAINQIEIHPGFQQSQLSDFCHAHNITCEAWSPLGGQNGTILRQQNLIHIAKSHKKSPAQVILRWHIQKGHIAIPKSSHPERIRENINIFDFRLDANEMHLLDSLETGNRQGPDPQTFNAKVPTRLMQLAHQLQLVKFK